MDNQKIPKKRKLSKDSIIFLILLTVFGTSFIIQQNLYHSSKQNDIITESFQYSSNHTIHEFEIIKPLNSSEQQLPAVILLNGDYISSKSLNLLKNEFLRNNFVVILAEIEIYNDETYTILSGILNETRNQNFIDPSRIGIMGHSNGAHYALRFAVIHNETIKAVICGNFGGINAFTSFTSNLFQRSNTPQNVLLVSDYKDPNPNRPYNDYLWLISYIPPLQSKVNTLYGSFNNSDARKVYVTNGIFSHSSSLYDPNAINEEISWMSQALNNKSSIDQTSNIRKHIFLGFFYFSLMCTAGFGFIAKIVIFSPQIEKKLSIFIQKMIDKYEKQYSNQNQINNTKFKLKLKDKSQRILDFRIEKIILSILFLMIISSFTFRNTGILFLKFPYKIMSIWASILLIVILILSKKNDIKKVFDYSIKVHIITFLSGFVIFILAWLMLMFVSNFWVGYKIPFVKIENFFFSFYLFFSVNTLFSYFEYELNSFLKGISFYIITFLILILISFLLTDYSNLILIYSFLLIISLLNPTMYRKNIHPLTITWFNYFLITFLFIWLL